MATYRFGYEELRSSTSVEPIPNVVRFRLRCVQITYFTMCWEVIE